MPLLSDVQIHSLLDLADQAGEAVMRVYATDFSVDYKADESPLTQADLASHRVILDGLARLFPDIPVLSEEAENADYDQRRSWERFFLVDPLDGTKEFVKRSDEFAVSIALIEGRAPDFGVIAAPALGLLYYGGRDYGAFKRSASGVVPVRVAPPSNGQGHIVLLSRSYPNPDLEGVLDRFPIRERRTAGSAYKFGLVAEGAATLYPRLGGTWEWDTAAGQAIVEGAGGVFTDLDGEPFLYNKPSLRNGPFLAIA